jgi:hypothetical protein
VLERKRCFALATGHEQHAVFARNHPPTLANPDYSLWEPSPVHMHMMCCQKDVIFPCRYCTRRLAMHTRASAWHCWGRVGRASPLCWTSCRCASPAARLRARCASAAHSWQTIMKALTYRACMRACKTGAHRVPSGMTEIELSMPEVQALGAQNACIFWVNKVPQYST